MIDQIVDQAKDWADTAVERLIARRAAKPRIETTRIPWRRSNNQWENMLSGPRYSKESVSMLPVGARSKRICDFAYCRHENRATFCNTYLDITELEQPKCVLVKKVRRRIYICDTCAKKFYSWGGE